MRKIRVLVVDDSAFMRKVIRDMLSSDESIEVVDTARDGINALDKLKSLQIDIITMDVEMPKMNGLQALIKINELYKIPVIMLSSLTREGADITIKALELGAFDFVLKPSLGADSNIDCTKAELLRKIKLCIAMQRPKVRELKDRTASMVIKNKGFLNTGIKAVCIAASTGGPKALTTVMSMFPENFKLPILIVQHMPAGFTKAFANRLDSISKLTVKEAEDGDDIKTGYAYISPGGYHMVVRNRHLLLNQEPPMHGVRPCADKLFTSAAENIDGKIIGIVLTGMGSDGALGLQAIESHGGVCIAQDESSCTIFGMPRSAIEKGVVHIVAPLERIVPEVLNITGV